MSQGDLMMKTKIVSLTANDFCHWVAETESGMILSTRYNSDKRVVVTLHDRMDRNEIHNEFLDKPYITTDEVIDILDFNGYELEDNLKLKMQYEKWWDTEGSKMKPEENEDCEEFARRVCHIAWMNGGDCAKNN